MSYVFGIDAHTSYSEIAVYKDSKKLVESKRISTSESSFIAFIRRYRSPRIVLFEESTLSNWLFQLFKPYCDDIIVCEPYANSLLYRTDQKSDTLDSHKLVQLHRMNMLKRVHHGDPAAEDLKRLVTQYHAYIRNQVRIKNQIHAKYRQTGIFIDKGGSYTLAAHEQYLAQVRSSALRQIITGQLHIVEVIDRQTRELLSVLSELSRPYSVLKAFRQIPGVGQIIAVTFFALIMTPSRFSSKEKLWSYCKIGIATQTSGGKVYKQRLTRRGNPLLKNVLMQAALKSITMKESCFKEMYQRLIQRGLAPSLARITVSRKIASTMYYIWLKECSFQPEYIR